jgi:HD-like signal output (HDOD) protein
MQNQQNSEIFRQVDSLPSLPATVSKVLALTAVPESSVEDLVHAILPDQAMCATILKLANSAFFGIPREVATMDKAIIVLGFNEVHNIVLEKAVFNTFQTISKNNKNAIDIFWAHSFSCGLAAKIIAEDFKCPPSELFIAGLIHDIGKLALFIARPNDYLQVLELTGTDQIRCKQMETETIGIDHEQVGFRLLSRWLFPDSLICAVGFHHQPEECSTTPLHAVIVQISDALILLTSAQDDAKKEPLLPQLLQLLPEGEETWKQYHVDINEEILQKWMNSLYISVKKDSDILNLFTS